MILAHATLARTLATSILFLQLLIALQGVKQELFTIQVSLFVKVAILIALLVEDLSKMIVFHAIMDLF